MDFQMDGMPPDVLQRLLQDMPELAIAPSPLVGVIPVAEVVEAAGITVEVLSVEVRQAGALIHWRCRADRPIAFLAPAVSIADDLGTSYRVSAANGGGDERSWAGQIAMVPAPPSGASVSITIQSFGADPRMKMPGWTPSQPVDGPWTFSVQARDIRER